MISPRYIHIVVMTALNVSAMDFTAEEHEHRFLNYVYTQAPKAAQFIVRHLQEPHFLDLPKYRAAFFVGEPGVGKTTLARAVAHKLVELSWLYHFFSCGDFQGKHRGEISLKLKTMFDELPASGKNIVVIDELNQLFDHADNENYDTDATSKTLWTFLDSQHGNHNFFLIGTMNSLEQAPQQIKSRLLGNVVWLDKLTLEQNVAGIKYLFATHPNTVLDPTCTDEFLKTTCARLLESGTTRDFEKLIGECAVVFRERDEQSKLRTLTPEDIAQACRRIDDSKPRMKWNTPKETAAQQQERLHNQLIEKQDEGFVKQVYLHIHSNSTLNRQDLWFHDIARVILSDKQMQFYKQLEAIEEERKRIEKQKKEDKEKAAKAEQANKSWWG